MVVARDSSGGSWGDGDGGEPETVMPGDSSLASCITSASGIVCGGSGTTVSGFDPP